MHTRAYIRGNIYTVLFRAAVWSMVSLFLGFCILVPVTKKVAWVLLQPRPAASAGAAVAPVKQSDNTFNPATTAWTYDFSKRPDGLVPVNDWQFERGTAVAGYHNELQAYTSRVSNARIENGMLVIDAHPESFDGRQYTSARMSTQGHFSFTYGTLEVDMMLPAGYGTWPAAWLMPKDNKYQTGEYGIASSDKFAWALNGEVDFMEAVGSMPGQIIPAAHSYNELHHLPTITPAVISNPYSQYHRFGVIKTPDRITFTLDGRPYATRTRTSDNPLDWPFNQPYYLILNLAIGGDWAGSQGIDISKAPWQMKVCSISYQPLPAGNTKNK
jgi:beta-glucanase (GH16 family)